MFMYIVRDVVVGEFMSQIYLFQNDEVALRWWSSAKEKTDYPNDLQIYKVGEIDLKTGEIKHEVTYLG